MNVKLGQPKIRMDSHQFSTLIMRREIEVECLYFTYDFMKTTKHEHGNGLGRVTSAVGKCRCGRRPVPHENSCSLVSLMLILIKYYMIYGLEKMKKIKLGKCSKCSILIYLKSKIPIKSILTLFLRLRSFENCPYLSTPCLLLSTLILPVK